MIPRLLSGLLLISLTACSGQEPPPGPTVTQSLAREDIVSGYEFLTPDTQSLQNDDFANPGFFWVDKGKAIFDLSTPKTPSCLSCHEDRLPGIAASYPAIDQASGQLVNLEGRINLCRERHQSSTPLNYESEALLSLTAYVAFQARGSPIAVSVDGSATEHYARGKDYFFTRRGQFNFSCSQCHDENWGMKLRGDTVSQGHPNGFPAYRFEWETFGSLHRRLHDCDMGVRAEPMPSGSQTYIDLELYLAKRAEGLALESPAIRR
jgi:sulfur-oxidizing protein SoxA